MNPREQIIRLQGQVDKQYAGLKDMAEERRRKLENMYHLFQLKREVDDLEQWIAEKDTVASSSEMGQDFDHVTVSILGPCLLCLPLMQQTCTALFFWQPGLLLRRPVSSFPIFCRSLKGLLFVSRF